MRSIKPTTIRLSDEDVKLVNEFKRRYGVSSLIGVIRLALRMALNPTSVAANVAQDKKPTDP